MVTYIHRFDKVQNIGYSCDNTGSKDILQVERYVIRKIIIFYEKKGINDIKLSTHVNKVNKIM